MSAQSKYVIVAALEREIAGLVRDWDAVTVEGSKFRVWRRGEVAAVAVGMGRERAFQGTKMVIERLCPELVTSVGFSGSLSTKLPVGSIFVPAQVIGFKNGQTHRTGYGKGTLVSVAEVAGASNKAEIAVQFGAQAVDMEAAAVAEACEGAGVRFAAVRSISDGVHDEMGFVGAFVTDEGFKTGAFLAHVAVRPKLWKALAALSRNTSAATAALTSALREFSESPEKFLLSHTNHEAFEKLSGVGQPARK